MAVIKTMLDKLDITQLQQIIDDCPVGILLQDNDGKIVWANNVLGDLLGNDRIEQLLNKSADEAPEPLKPLFNLNTTLHLPADEQHEDLWLIGQSKPLQDSNGVIQYFTDLTPLHWLMQERDLLKDELEDIVMVDAETGMRNRKGLYYSLEPQISRSRRYDRPLSLIVMRLDCIDRFKQQYGRDDASPLLVTISHLLNDQLRWADIIGRLDETDFLLVLPETHIENANTVAENIREKLPMLTIADVKPGDFTITAQFGVAEWRKGDDMGLLLMRARSLISGNTDPQPVTTG